MTKTNPSTLTVLDLVKYGIEAYIEQNGWSYHDEERTEEISKIIHAVFGVALDYSVIEDTIDEYLRIDIILDDDVNNY